MALFWLAAVSSAPELGDVRHEARELLLDVDLGREDRELLLQSVLVRASGRWAESMASFRGHGLGPDRSCSNEATIQSATSPTSPRGDSHRLAPATILPRAASESSGAVRIGNVCGSNRRSAAL